MPAGSVEERLAAIEEELARIKQQLAATQTPTALYAWEKIFGSFADSEGFEEATRLGREYRESLRPEEDQGSA